MEHENGGYSTTTMMEILKTLIKLDKNWKQFEKDSELRLQRKFVHFWKTVTLSYYGLFKEEYEKGKLLSQLDNPKFWKNLEIKTHWPKKSKQRKGIDEYDVVNYGEVQGELESSESESEVSEKKIPIISNPNQSNLNQESKPDTRTD